MIHRKIAIFFKLDCATGLFLALATITALIVANSQLEAAYHQFFALPLPLNLQIMQKNLSLRDWINDALMAVFFLLVGLELKKEILIGELSSKTRASLPFLAAVGGVIFPALIFFLINSGDEQALRGMAIPTATDIAFAYGVISLFGNKFSTSLKVFLVALAVIDDLIAIIIITLFYSTHLDFAALIFASIIVVLLAFVNLKKIDKIFIYWFLGILLWLAILKSGVHATLSGVILSIFIPINVKHKNLLEHLAKQLSPIVNFAILPIFAFANSGVKIDNFSIEILSNKIVLGVWAGLFFGKQIGVMLFSFLAIKLKISHLPRGTNWREFYCAAIFTAIGFTMSLFIASLAFAQNNEFFDLAKIGILFGSFLSIVFGCFVALIKSSSK